MLQGANDEIGGTIWIADAGAGSYTTRFTPNGTRTSGGPQAAPSPHPKTCTTLKFVPLTGNGGAPPRAGPKTASRASRPCRDWTYV